MTRTLFRLMGEVSREPGDAEHWGSTLRAHLRVSDITTIALRIAGTTRYYVVLEGCGRCLDGACRFGCRAQLLGRAVRGLLDGGDLKPVREPQGLVSGAYDYGVFCWPKANTTLADIKLAAADDVRMCLHWQYAAGGLRVGGLLLASTPPERLLSTERWRTVSLPLLLRRRLGRAGLPPVLPGQRWYETPWLLVKTHEIQKTERAAQPESTTW